MVGHRPLEASILVRIQVRQLRNAMTKMLDLDSNWEGVGKQEFPLAELFKPRGLKAQRSEQ